MEQTIANLTESIEKFKGQSIITAGQLNKLTEIENNFSKFNDDFKTPVKN